MCASEIGHIYDKKRNLLTSDKLEMCAILLEQFNSGFLQPLIPTNRYLIQMFSSLLNQLHVRMMNCSLLISPFTEYIIIDSIREFSSNSAAGPGGIPCSLLLNCAYELVPSFWILFKQSLSSGVIDPSLKRADIVPVSSRVIEQPLVTIAPLL